MARILILAFSGGGNLPPSLGIARELTARGHNVTFAGDPAMIPRIKRTSFRAVELTEAYAQIDLYPRNSPHARVACFVSSPAVEAQVRAVVEVENPDFVLIDFLFFGALNQALHFAQPSAVMAHMAFFRVANAISGLSQFCNAARERAAFAPLPRFEELLAARDRVIVTSLGAIDPPPPASPFTRNIRHVGPALATEAHAQPLDFPWGPHDPTPLVLISFSTNPMQAASGLIQRTLDALALLDVHAVATVGNGVCVDDLSAPPNALIVEAADHEALMAKAALVVTHGGHGTIMRALKHGVPMLVMPGVIPDQAPNAAMVVELGAGRVLTQDADSVSIRALARDVLATHGYRARAMDIAKLFSGFDGAIGAADEIEALLAQRETTA
jgi:MGT family glycosyltransferase